MRLFKYWARSEAPVESDGRSWVIECVGASDESVEDAKRRAGEIAARTAAAIAAGESKHYAYGDRPLREEIVDEFTDGRERFAVLTRNGYGSLVLNTAGVLFADIDYPRESFGTRMKRRIGRWFGRAKPAGAFDDAVIERVASVTAVAPELAIRLYRTRNGFRCLVTSRTYEPASLDAEHLLERLGADPLYVRLCRAQSCFRARVTPKGWRCGAPRPPHRFPWRDRNEERAYRRWEHEYERAIGGHATCAFVGAFGDAPTHPTAEEVVTIHDGLACDGDRPLA